MDFPFLRGADGTQLIKVDDKIDCKFLYFYLRTLKIENQDRYERHFKYLKTTFIPTFLTLKKQEEIVREIEGYEAEIERLEEVMKQSADRKKAIVEKYLQ